MSVQGFPETQMIGGPTMADTELNKRIVSLAAKLGGVSVVLAVYAATADIWFSGGDAAYAATVNREGVTEENAEAFHQHWLKAFAARLEHFVEENEGSSTSAGRGSPKEGE